MSYSCMMVFDCVLILQICNAIENDRIKFKVQKEGMCLKVKKQLGMQFIELIIIVILLS